MTAEIRTAERELLIALAHYVLWPPRGARFKTHNHALKASHEALRKVESEEADLSMLAQPSELLENISKLEDKILKLRNLGGQFSNVIYNLAQREGKIEVSDGELKRLDDLRKQWDKLVREM